MGAIRANNGGRSVYDAPTREKGVRKERKGNGIFFRTNGFKGAAAVTLEQLLGRLEGCDREKTGEMEVLRPGVMYGKAWVDRPDVVVVLEALSRFSSLFPFAACCMEKSGCDV